MIINKVRRLYNKYKFIKEFDLTKVREQKIDGNKKVADSKLYFYYDETENFGKMCVRADKKCGFNNEPFSPVFMLGGIFSNYEISNSIADELIQSIKIKGNPSDIKFSNVFGKKCGFENILKNENLKVILDWIDKYDIYLHFIEYNIFYDVTNTIYSSLRGVSSSDEKELLKKLIINNSKEFSNLLIETGFPNIKNMSYFWGKLKHILFDKIVYRIADKTNIEYIINRYNKCVTEELKNKINIASSNNYKLRNNVSNQKGILTDNLSTAYELPLIIFKNSLHYFDNENVIKKFLSDTPIYIDRKRIKNYEFVNIVENKRLVSEEIKAVYICDWIVRILQQTIQYLRLNGYETFYPYIKKMTRKEYDNFTRLCNVIAKSKKNNPFSFCFMDEYSIPYRFNWLINYKETIMKASIFKN